MNASFHGLTAAPYTPFHPDRSLNPDVVPAYARLLREAGVRAVFICGTTGEGPSLTSEERMLLAERWISEAGPGLRVIVHVGHTSLTEARALAVHAAQTGAAAIAALAPYFYKPRDTAELVDWCAAVADAVPELPFYYYHIPSMTGVSLPVTEFLRTAEKRIPSLAGVKYTHEDLNEYGACMGQWGSRFDLLFGRDELLLEGLEKGARGAVGSTYNYAAPVYLRLMAARKSGDLVSARTLQDQAIKMIQICNGTGVTHLAASKAVMAMLGVDCGPVRLPLAQPNAAQIQQLRAELDAIGFFEFCRPNQTASLP